MSDHDELSRRLRELAAAASQQADLETAAEVRRRAARRRTATVAAVSVAAVGLVLGSYTIAASIDDQRSVGPVAPSSATATTQSRPSPTETTQSQPSPTERETSSIEPTETKGTETKPRESQPTESQPTESQPTETSTSQGDWITTIPADIKLPQGVEFQYGDYGDWSPDPSWRSWRLLPCLAQKGYPSDAAQTDRQSVLQTAPELAFAEQLGLYPDGAEAATAIEEMKTSLADCAEQPGEPDRYGDTYDYYWGTRSAELTSQGSPDDAFHAWSWYRMYNSLGQETSRLGGEFFTVVREGNAIYLMMKRGESDYSYSSNVNRQATVQTRLTAQFMPTLCRFSSPGGC